LDATTFLMQPYFAQARALGIRASREMFMLTASEYAARVVALYQRFGRKTVGIPFNDWA
jgi:hypothetical protein